MQWYPLQVVTAHKAAWDTQHGWGSSGAGGGGGLWLYDPTGTVISQPGMYDTALGCPDIAGSNMNVTGSNPAVANVTGNVDGGTAGATQFNPKNSLQSSEGGDGGTGLFVTSEDVRDLFGEYTNDYCVSPDGSGTTGFMLLSGWPAYSLPPHPYTAATNLHANQVVPGYGTVDVTIEQEAGFYAEQNITDVRSAEWLNEGFPDSSIATAYLSVGPAGGTMTTTYAFDQPTGNIDLILLDMDYDDSVAITARDSNGNPISDFSGWRFVAGDMSDNASTAAPPIWHAGTATVVSTQTNGSGVPNNANRSYGVLTPDTLVTEIVILYDVPTHGIANGQHIYTTLHSTQIGRDGEICQLGAIGNYVWLDENSDGYQDVGELGIPNVIVNMTDSGGNTYTTTTDTHGGYLFDSLPAGTYTVTVDGSQSALSDLTYTVPNLTGSDFGNQDPAGYAVTIGGSEPLENLTADFGYNHNPTTDVDNGENNAAIGDTVWLDTDGDGVQDPHEVGIADVCVELFNAGPDGIFDPGTDGQYGTADDDSVQVGSTLMTDANGNYIFTNLAPNAYVVQLCASNFDPGGALENYAQTGDPDHFGQPETGSYGENDGMTTTPVVLGPGDVFLNADFGYQPASPLGTIGDTVWFDADASGTATMDAGESGIPGVTVALIKDTNGNGVWDAGEPIIATDTTDEDGKYLFEGLPLDDGGGDSDADYIVWVNDTDNVLGGLMQTYDQDSPLDNMSATALDSGSPNDLDQDFSYTPAGHNNGDGLIGDTVWFDVDNSGGNQTTQGDEPGIEGVIVTLTDSTGAVITTTTNENGNYWFGGLDPSGTYTVTIAPLNFATGGVLEGLSETYEPDGGTASQSVVDLSSTGPIDLNQDFSYTGDVGGQVGNLIWLDVDADGLYEPAAGETLINGVTVDLYRDLNGNGQVDPGEPLFATATTSGNDGDVGADVGNYLFGNLPLNSEWVVNVTDEAGILNGYWHSLGTPDTTDNSQVDPDGVGITAAAPSNVTADFGYYLDPACLGNFVWEDVNGNGVQEGGEPRHRRCDGDVDH